MISTDTMKGLWLEQGRLTLRTDLPKPKPSVGEALIRVLQTGICSTDLALCQGLYPFTGIIGHEFVGIVEQGSPAWRGRRVVGEINLSCGHCRYCLRGLEKHCQTRSVLGIRQHHGAFADYLVLPEQNLHPVPTHLSDDAAVLVEPLAAALDVSAQWASDPPERALIIGDGRMAQLIARVVSAATPTTVLGKHPQKLARLPSGIEITADPAIIADGSFDCVIESTGNESGLLLALDKVSARGLVILKSTYGRAVAVDTHRIVVDELVIKGSRCGHFPTALNWLVRAAPSILDAPQLIDAHFPLTHALDAFAACADKSKIKIVVTAN